MTYATVLDQCRSEKLPPAESALIPKVHVSDELE